MAQIFLVTFPFFALILLGYLATRRGLVPLSAISGINAYVLYFALPCMLYRFAANLEVQRLFDVHAIAVYTLCGLLIVGLTLLTAGPSRLGWNNASFGALVAAFPNSGFMGMPMIVALVGPERIGPVVVSISIDMILTSSLCIALSRLGQNSGKVQQTLKVVAKGVLVNPLPWAITLGALASAYTITLYAPVNDVVNMLANSCSPIALFTIGAMLARPSQPQGVAQPINATDTPAVANGNGLKGWFSFDVNLIVLYKLVLHPLLVFAVGWGYTRLGFNLGADTLTILVLTATLPSASSITVLAERYQADSQRIARIVMISTVIAFITFSMAADILV